MTIPAERSRATKYAQDFMRDLLDPKVTPRVPSGVREMARRILKHFPSAFDLQIAHQNNPELWGPAPATTEPGYETYDAYRDSRIALYRELRPSRHKRSRKSRR